MHVCVTNVAPFNKLNLPVLNFKQFTFVSLQAAMWRGPTTAQHLRGTDMVISEC